MYLKHFVELEMKLFNAQLSFSNFFFKENSECFLNIIKQVKFEKKKN